MKFSILIIAMCFLSVVARAQESPTLVMTDCNFDYDYRLRYYLSPYDIHTTEDLIQQAKELPSIQSPSDDIYCDVMTVKDKYYNQFCQKMFFLCELLDESYGLQSGIWVAEGELVVILLSAVKYGDDVTPIYETADSENPIICANASRKKAIVHDYSQNRLLVTFQHDNGQYYTGWVDKSDTCASGYGAC